MTTQATLKINFTRHPGQSECLSGILRHKPSVSTIVASRGWGKTLWTTCDIVAPLMAQVPGAQVMWVAPTYKVAKAPIEDVWFGRDEVTGQNYIPQFDPISGIQFWDYKRGDMELHLINTSKLFLRTADNPAAIVAKGYNLIVIDEAAQISKEVFMQYILPTARRQGCRIFLITTPRGRNWVYEMYLAGQDISKTDYFSIKQPWSKRPNYPELLKRLMHDMPEHLRRQEFEAEFISDSTGVFKNIENVFTGEPIDFPDSDQEWECPIQADERDSDTRILAVDLAKQSDYTVIVVMGVNSKKLYYYARFNKSDYKIVLERIKRVASKYEADVVYDATGVGSGVGDFLSGDLNVVPFVFTNQSKNQIVNKLAISCEYGEIKLPNITTMRQEFELFTYTINRTGSLSYSAPDGKHDDTVMALAMALWYISENSGSANVESIDDFLSVVDSVRQPRSRLQMLLEEND